MAVVRWTHAPTVAEPAMPIIHESLTNPDAHVAEEDLLMPAIMALYKAKEAGYPKITGLVLVNALERLNAMSAADRAVPEGDRLNAFQRRVVNLIKNTLVAQGYARQHGDGTPAQITVALTPKGERALEALEALEVEIDQLAMAVFLL